MIIRSKAPLRIGLAGGGTDVSPYCDEFGGAILNATISLYAHATIQPLKEDIIIIEAADRKEKQQFSFKKELPIDETLSLHKGIYNYLASHHKNIPSGFKLTTYVDAPAGSGLGTSSTLVVAILGAFSEWLKLPLGDYDLAHLAYRIEREDLAMAGGRQDQYAATFGGVNFMEFYKNDKVIVNPLRIHPEYLHELANNLLLFYTDTQRNSSSIIEAQSKNVVNKNKEALEAMHQLKSEAYMMKESLLKGDIDAIGRHLDFGFHYKKQLAGGISNPNIEAIYEAAKKAGASGGKISGAGGGGFVTFYCPENNRFAVIEALKQFKGSLHPYQFTNHGLVSWTML